MKKRRTFDSQGKPVVEVKNADGVYEPEVDGNALREFNVEDLRILETRKQQLIGTNPYQGASVPESKKLRQRSGLDYLRQLSEEIKRKRGTSDNGDDGSGQ